MVAIFVDSGTTQELDGGAALFELAIDVVRQWKILCPFQGYKLLAMEQVSTYC